MTSERELRYRKAQADRGLKAVRVWVPESDIERLKKYAEKLRKAHSIRQPRDTGQIKI